MWTLAIFRDQHCDSESSIASQTKQQLVSFARAETWELAKNRFSLVQHALNRWSLHGVLQHADILGSLSREEKCHWQRRLLAKLDGNKPIPRWYSQLWDICYELLLGYEWLWGLVSFFRFCTVLRVMSTWTSPANPSPLNHRSYYWNEIKILPS